MHMRRFVWLMHWIVFRKFHRNAQLHCLILTIKQVRDKVSAIQTQLETDS
jgi:hypothetical protein